MWTPQTLQATLDAATKVFDPASAFEIRELYTADRAYWKAGLVRHREYRVTLQRVAAGSTA